MNTYLPTTSATASFLQFLKEALSVSESADAPVTPDVVPNDTTSIDSTSSTGSGELRFTKGDLYFHGIDLESDAATISTWGKGHQRECKSGSFWGYHDGVNKKNYGVWCPGDWDFDATVTNSSDFCSNCEVIKNCKTRPTHFRCLGHPIV